MPQCGAQRQYFRGDGRNGARPAFAEERDFGGLARLYFYMRRESVAGEAGFCDGDRYAAVAYVVRGLQFPFARERNESGNQPLFRSQSTAGGEPASMP